MTIKINNTITIQVQDIKLILLMVKKFINAIVVRVNVCKCTVIALQWANFADKLANATIVKI